jgi:uncharacterized protein YndB with AHSA1/START domain
VAVDVTREIRIAARPETVFEFLVDPALQRRWMGTDAQLEPQPGGLYRVVVNPRSTVRGEFVEVVPHSRVVFTWGFEEPDATVPPGMSTVEVTLMPDGEGTLLRLVHRDLPEPSSAQHDMGWEHFLGRLGIAAAGRDPGPDPWAA